MNRIYKKYDLYDEESVFLFSKKGVHVFEN